MGDDRGSSDTSGHQQDHEVLRSRKDFSKWAKKHREPLIDWIRRRWPKCDAEAIVNEAFKKVWARRRELRRNPSLKLLAYTRKVVLNLARRGGKQRARRRDRGGNEGLLALPDAGRLPDEEAAYREEAERLRNAISSLSERERAVIAGRMASRSYREIAEELGVPESTARSLHRRALRKLRDLLNGDGD